MGIVILEEKRRPPKELGGRLHCISCAGRYDSSMHMHFVLRYLGTVAAFILTVYLVPGLVVTGGWETILLAALVWSVIVMVIRPVLKILTLPITILTFGIFSLLLNALLFWTMSLIVPGFHITTFFAAFLGAIVLSLLSWLIHLAL